MQAFETAGPPANGAVTETDPWPGSPPEGVVLTGTRGAGKSTVACGLDGAGAGVHVRSVTTRGPRDDDRGHYDYLERSAFATLADAGEFLVVAEYGGHRYGVRARDAQAATAAGLPPILTLTPAAAGTFLGLRRRERWRGVFLDAPDTVLDSRLAGRGTLPDGVCLAQRACDRAHAGRLPVVLNAQSLDATVGDVVRLLGLRAAGT